MERRKYGRLYYKGTYRKQKTMKQVIISGILISLLLSGFFYGCKSSKVTSVKTEKEVLFRTATSPVQLKSPRVKFYENVAYGPFAENVLDIYLPDSGQPAALVINIHGGGFINGDKAQQYKSGGSLINALLLKNIAYASINYRLISQDGLGVLKCLQDSKRALQFLRHHAQSFNIDKNRVVLTGGSAGAGTALWIALNDDMSDKKSADPVLKESTRVKAVVALSTQANYDVLEWGENVFKEYKAQGLDQKYIINMAGEERVLSFYGFKNFDEANSEAGRIFRDKLNMLKLMSVDDPVIYVENTKIPYSKPSKLGELQHHPLHAKALLDRAKETKVAGSFYIPEMNIDTRKGEDKLDFIIRVLAN